MINSHLLENIAGYVAGRWAESLATLEVRNPATGELLANAPDMGAEQTRAAIDSAASAMEKPIAVEQRVEWLQLINESLLANKEEMARIITLEQGKPLKESRGEVEYAAGFFHFFAHQLSHLNARDLPEPIRNLRWRIYHRPAGVVGLITPWNFPLAMLAKKLAPAMAAGCAVVTKPAELTPLTSIALWHLLQKLNIPAGWLNLVVGQPKPIGEALFDHPAVRLISFTGSTETGRLLIRQSATRIKRLALELGGNAPYLVMEDADVGAAAEALIPNKFRCAGQTCVCANRILVHRNLSRLFTDAVVQRVRQLRTGDGMDAQTDIGPLISSAAVEKVRQHVKDAINGGAACMLAGTIDTKLKGHFYPPTVLWDVKEGATMFQEETFGPVVPIAMFDSENQAICQANGTPYGLAAYIFTTDAARANNLAARLNFGHVGINTGMGPTPEAPFGGMKQSGFGREGGVEGLLEYCEVQTVVRP